MTRTQSYESTAVTISPKATCVDAADLMDEQGVGCVIVVDDAAAPLGIVTDRDLCCRVVAAGRDPKKTSAADIMSENPVTGRPNEPLLSLLARMKEAHVRRIPLVEKGKVVGILSHDDLVSELSAQLWNVSESIHVEVRDGRRGARQRRRQEAREDTVEELRSHLSSLGERARKRVVGDLESLVDRFGGGKSR